MADQMLISGAEVVHYAAAEPSVSLISWTFDGPNSWVTMRGTAAELQTWTTTGRRYRAELDDAAVELDTALRRRWLPPGSVSSATTTSWRRRQQPTSDHPRRPH